MEVECVERITGGTTAFAAQDRQDPRKIKHYRRAYGPLIIFAPAFFPSTADLSPNGLVAVPAALAIFITRTTTTTPPPSGPPPPPPPSGPPPPPPPSGPPPPPPPSEPPPTPILRTTTTTPTLGTTTHHTPTFRTTTTTPPS
ncbi:hypothetical protein NHX12_021165 [Muraenolepis orangiensis]|uniref:Uncharacterized protein n=1 Tax=Muraenolepis orangiensis TaxID=630683 RepID=A0A9Q0EPY8_9TELE|nr:hypothetical protein NHX12_021165 [Muraenolepis orangiensis]